MVTLLIFAGRSTRFWPLSEKSFFSVAGTNLLSEQVKRLKAAGAKEIVLVGGKHNHSLAKKLFPKLAFVEQKDLELGMRGALLSSLPRLGTKPVMIVSGNDLIDIEGFAAMYERAKNLKDGGLILARKVKTYFPGGYLSLKGKKIVSIVEKPGAGNEPSKMVTIVVHAHSSASALIKALKSVKTSKDDGYEVALDTLFKEYSYEAVTYEGSWTPVKYPWHLLDLLQQLLPSEGQQIPASCQIHTSAVIEGPVILEKNVRVLPHATIVGPAYIGEGTIVGTNALVRQSSIGKNSVIGYNTEIARSVVGDDVWTHSSYVGDSVLGNNVALGAGTTTGNLRLDEGEIVSQVKGETINTGRNKLGVVIGNDCRIGVHTTVFPGVKVGTGTFVGPQVLLTEDIPEHSFVKKSGGDALSIKPNKKTAPGAAEREKFKKRV